MEQQDPSPFKFPTETIELPSKGILYPEGHALSNGTIEMKYMTAREEDILTNQNYIANGTVLDKLLQSLIITKFDYNDLLIGDKNAILIASRILGYGKDYTFKFRNEATSREEEYTVDLTTLKEKEIDEALFEKGKNEFKHTLSKSGNVVTFKLLTGKDEKSIDAEIKGLQKVNPDSSFENTTRLKHMITSINGKTDQASIRDFVENHLLAPESRELKKIYNDVSPDIDTVVTVEKDGYVQEGVVIPININFSICI